MFLRNCPVRNVAESNYFVLRILIKNLGIILDFPEKIEKS